MSDRKTGSLNANGNGSTTSFTVAHGLGAIPSFYDGTVAHQDAGNAGLLYVAADATNLTFQFKTAPISGSNNVIVKWVAQL